MIYQYQITAYSGNNCYSSTYVFRYWFCKRQKDDVNAYGFQMSWQHEEAQEEARQKFYLRFFYPRFGCSTMALSLTLIVSLASRPREDIYTLALHKGKLRQKPHLPKMIFWEESTRPGIKCVFTHSCKAANSGRCPVPKQINGWGTDHRGGSE